MKHAFPRRVGLAGLVLWLLSATASPALAHATLLSSTVRDGDTFATVPDTATFTFSEAVTLPRDAARLFDASAVRVAGVIARVEGAQVNVTFPTLSAGAYLLTLAVISDDGHHVLSPVRFVVGSGTQLDDAATDSLVSTAANDVTRPYVTVLRALAYLAAFFTWGFVWLGRRLIPHALFDQARRTVRRIAIVGAVASVAAGALVGWWVYAPEGVGELLGLFTADATRGFLLRSVAFVGLGLTLGVAGISHLSAVALMAGYVLDGHQLSIGTRWLMLLADATHLVAGSVWFGGVWLLWWLWRRDGDAAKSALHTFSGVAAIAALATVAGGVAMASQIVDGPGAVLNTPYGRIFGAKLVVVGVIGVLAVRLRRVTTRDNWSVVSVTSWLRRDVMAFVTVLLLTAVLVGVNPQSGTDTLLAQRVALGDATLEVVVEPSVDGVRVIHAYIIDDAGTLAAVSELNVVASFTALDGTQIGPLAIEMAWVSDGHFLTATDRLPFAGTWEFTFEAPRDRFTIDTATLLVIAP